MSVVCLMECDMLYLSGVMECDLQVICLMKCDRCCSLQVFQFY